MTDSTDDRARQQAALQLESIREMVAALEVDYGRLEELRDAYSDLDAEDEAALAELQREWKEDNGDELAELEKDAGDCDDLDDAEQRISEDALSVQVRSGWHDVGEEADDKNGEYEILLCTGGPACRIRGDLSDGEPSRARLEYQDWGTPWTKYVTTGSDNNALMTYAARFFGGW